MDRSQNPPDNKVESGEMADEECQVHKHVNDETSHVEMSEDETTTTMTSPSAPQSVLLEGVHHR